MSAEQLKREWLDAGGSHAESMRETLFTELFYRAIAELAALESPAPAGQMPDWRADPEAAAEAWTPAPVGEHSPTPATHKERI